MNEIPEPKHLLDLEPARDGYVMGHVGAFMEQLAEDGVPPLTQAAVLRKFAEVALAIAGNPDPFQAFRDYREDSWRHYHPQPTEPPPR